MNYHDARIFVWHCCQRQNYSKATQKIPKGINASAASPQSSPPKMDLPHQGADEPSQPTRFLALIPWRSLEKTQTTARNCIVDTGETLRLWQQSTGFRRHCLCLYSVSMATSIDAQYLVSLASSASDNLERSQLVHVMYSEVCNAVYIRWTHLLWYTVIPYVLPFVLTQRRMFVLMQSLSMLWKIC